MLVLKIIFLILNLLLFINGFHFVFFALLPFFKKEKKMKDFKPKTRFLILIAARNEELVIPDLIDSIKSQNYVNVIVASKHPSYQWLSMDEAIKHCTKGLGIWNFASNDNNNEPDVVMVACGDTPTVEVLAAISILNKELPDLKIRCINIVDLMRLESPSKHPHGLNDEEYDLLFTKDKPIIFNYHGYPSLIRELTYLRRNHNISVHGYLEEGTITTPFDMRVQNKIDRFHLVIDVIKHLNYQGSKEIYLMEKMKNKIIEHNSYIREYGEDMPEIKEWKWKK